jgi:amino acid permease
MPRELGDLTLLSALGFFGSIFLMFVLLFEFLTNEGVVPNMMLKVRNADLLIVKWDNIVETIPFIVFLYMYQPLIPQYYKELK